MVELVKIQSELNCPKNQFNAFGKYKYRSCEDILEGLKSHLLKHDCFVTLTDDVIECTGVLMIKATATITNSEGKSISVSAFAGIDPNKKGMDISQTFGSSSSYARKYALNGLFAIDDTKDADTQNNTPSKAKTATKPANKSTGSNTKVKPTLGTNTGGYNKAWLAYRDADSNDKRNSIKQSILNAYADANEVIAKLDNDLGEYIGEKSK